jgi:hypothetical protein
VLLVSVVSAGRGRVLVHEVQQGIEVSSSLVLFGSALLRVPVESGVTLHLDVTGVVFGSIEVCNHQVIESSEVLS